jgi:hypothetical protein
MTASVVAALPRLVDALVAEPLSGVDAAELRARVASVAPQLARLEGWLRAAAAQVEVAGAGQVPRADGSAQSTAAWLADVRRRTPSAAGSELRASALLRQVPLVADAVLDRLRTPEQAAVLTRLVDKIDQASLLAAQPDLITVAAGLDPTALGRWVQHLIATHGEPALEADAARGRAKRYLQTSRDADGSLRGRFVLAGEDAESLLTALEPLARPQGRTDDRSAGQRRADALVEMCEQVLRHGELPEHGGQRPQLSYVLPADWAAARQAEAACTHCGPRCPAHRPARFTDTRRPPRPARGAGRARLRSRSVNRPADPHPNRGAAVRRPPVPRPARPVRAGRGLQTLTDSIPPRPSGGRWPPATSTAPPAAAPAHPPCATPTT